MSRTQLARGASRPTICSRVRNSDASGTLTSQFMSPSIALSAEVYLKLLYTCLLSRYCAAVTPDTKSGCKQSGTISFIRIAEAYNILAHHTSSARLLRCILMPCTDDAYKRRVAPASHHAPCLLLYHLELLL